MNELTKIDAAAEPQRVGNNAITAAMQRIEEKAKRIGPVKVISNQTQEIDEKLSAAGFPKRHRLQLRDGIHGPGFEKAKALAPRVIAGDCLLLLVGLRGPGKTQMATWWAAERVKVEKSAGYYRKTADVITEIKTTWQDGGKKVDTEDDVLKKYRRCSYLVLDEFHERGSSDWEARTLINILDHRYDAMLATVLIANMSREEVAQLINPSIVSRAEETGGLVLCDWASYRTKL